MKIQEIEKIGFTDIGDLPLSLEEIESAEQVATCLQLPLMHFSKSGDEFYFIIQDNKVVAWVAGKIITYRKDGRKALALSHSKVDINYRGKGLMTQLYSDIYNKLQLSLISDAKQSMDGAALWKKMMNSGSEYTVKKYNSKTGEIADIDDINSVYGNKEWRLLAEATDHQYGFQSQLFDNHYSRNRMDLLAWNNPHNLGKD